MIVLVSGCSDEVDGLSQTKDSAVVSVTASVPAQEAVVRGIDSCDVLDSAAARRLGVASQPVDHDSNEFATRCSWIGLDKNFEANLTMNEAVGLDRSVDLDVHIPVEIQGHPAVQVDENGGPTCRYWVEITSNQTFSAGASSLSASAPPLCEKARALASEVLDALRK
ncbi:DUF3558 domain-containing protein [Pseudonocardia halophobica]|uniref:DUF3558 domain-containing protein n=1 Tax=Pseudonocardia halophobica TaxID=29401 RepID=UPI003D8CFD98